MGNSTPLAPDLGTCALLLGYRYRGAFLSGSREDGAAVGFYKLRRPPVCLSVAVPALAAAGNRTTSEPSGQGAPGACPLLILAYQSGLLLRRPVSPLLRITRRDLWRHCRSSSSRNIRSRRCRLIQQTVPAKRGEATSGYPRFAVQSKQAQFRCNTSWRFPLALSRRLVCCCCRREAGFLPLTLG